MIYERNAQSGLLLANTLDLAGNAKPCIYCQLLLLKRAPSVTLYCVFFDLRMYGVKVLNITETVLSIVGRGLFLCPLFVILFVCSSVNK